MTRPILTLTLAAALAACATTIPATEIALTAAERTALAYVTQPRCTAAPVVTCSDPATVARIKAADAVAYSAVVAARTGGSTADAAAAVAALAALVPVSK